MCGVKGRGTGSPGCSGRSDWVHIAEETLIGSMGEAAAYFNPTNEDGQCVQSLQNVRTAPLRHDGWAWDRIQMYNTCSFHTVSPQDWQCIRYNQERVFLLHQARDEGWEIKAYFNTSLKANLSHFTHTRNISMIMGNKQQDWFHWSRHQESKYWSMNWPKSVHS